MKPLDYLKKLEENGYEAYIVGGYVRDYLEGITTNDIDITTSARPQDISRIFGMNLSDILGSVNIKNNNLNIDITTYRSECEYFKHKPKSVEYISDIILDLKRRDFTINAICMDKNGNIFDPIGGTKDLIERTIRCIGDIQKKFSEDPLRMLRALRISIIYDFNIGREELKFILNNTSLFDEITYECKRSEMDKILISDNCIDGLNKLKKLGLLKVLGINFNNIKYTHDLIGMWAQLDFDSKYPFKKNEKKRIINIREILYSGKIDALTLFNYGLYDTLVAAKILGVSSTSVNEIYNDMQIKSENELAIKGNVIRDILNLKDFKLIKVIKKDLIQNVISGNLTNREFNLKSYIIEKWK